MAVIIYFSSLLVNLRNICLFLYLLIYLILYLPILFTCSLISNVYWYIYS